MINKLHVRILRKMQLEWNVEDIHVYSHVQKPTAAALVNQSVSKRFIFCTYLCISEGRFSRAALQVFFFLFPVLTPSVL